MYVLQENIYTWHTVSTNHKFTDTLHYYQVPRVTWDYLSYVCLCNQVRDILEGKDSKRTKGK